MTQAKDRGRGDVDTPVFTTGFCQKKKWPVSDDFWLRGAPPIQKTISDENKAIDSPTPRSKEAKMPHCKIYNPMTELTIVRARERISAYGIPVAIGLRVFVGRLLLVYRRYILRTLSRALTVVSSIIGLYILQGGV